MVVATNADFSGYATKANLKCSDGRTIAPNAFLHQDSMKVPLVWAHAHGDQDNILGHAILENRDDGVYCYGFFNESAKGKHAKMLVEHEDLTALSIYANKLVEKAGTVLHGMIREVSLVLAGANAGAQIDFVNIQHEDGSLEPVEDEAVIYTGLSLVHGTTESAEEDPSDNSDDATEESDDSEVVQHAEKTLQDVYNSFSDEQKKVLFFMVSEALRGNNTSESAQHADMNVDEVFHSFTEEQKETAYFMISEALETSKANSNEDADDKASDDTAAHADKEGNTMTHNVFEQSADNQEGGSLSHADIEMHTAEIFKLAATNEENLKTTVKRYALQHGIDNIDVLFPDAKAITATPEFLSRRVEWVSEVMSGTRHTPFSRIKSVSANLTYDEARAKGYIKGNLKKEEFFPVSKRITTPTTIYKKQQLDRDDILDITDFDVVVWLKGEMRLMLEEEIARAILLGDGRDPGDDDKIQEVNVRPIATDADLYVTRLNVNLSDASSSADEVIDSLVLNRRYYRGSGNPVLFMGETLLAQLLMIKDTMGRRIYSTTLDLLAALRVSKIVTVELMDAPSVTVAAIMVNLQDYVVGADQGGNIALFDDFDIDYNKYKYLIETRISGALVKAKSAIVVNKVTGTLVTPVAPSWNAGTHTLTPATTSGITYKREDTGATVTTGAPITLSTGQEIIIQAVPTAGNYLASSAGDEFRFTYESGQADSAF